MPHLPKCPTILRSLRSPLAMNRMTRQSTRASRPQPAAKPKRQRLDPLKEEGDSSDEESRPRKRKKIDSPSAFRQQLNKNAASLENSALEQNTISILY